jgi:hypothetical protein
MIQSKAGNYVAASLLCAALLVALPAAAAPESVKLAIFEFELEDTSAGAASTGEASSDATQLAVVTNEVRQLLAESGHYVVIDVSRADADAVKTHQLHDCEGCDAPAALNLGADQSLVGVIRRISRTEYIIRFQLRDARSGAIVSAGNSGLRMGADYSWSRGAKRLVSDRLLESRPPQ